MEDEEYQKKLPLETRAGEMAKSTLTFFGFIVVMISLLYRDLFERISFENALFLSFLLLFAFIFLTLSEIMFTLVYLPEITDKIRIFLNKWKYWISITFYIFIFIGSIYVLLQPAKIYVKSILLIGLIGLLVIYSNYIRKRGSVRAALKEFIDIGYLSIVVNSIFLLSSVLYASILMMIVPQNIKSIVILYIFIIWVVLLFIIVLLTSFRVIHKTDSESLIKYGLMFKYLSLILFFTLIFVLPLILASKPI